MAMKDGAEPGSIAAFHDDLLAGRVTCEERISEELANIAEYRARHNAFITIFDGKKGIALSRARVLDARLAGQKGPLPPLFGVPLTIKDNTFFGGFPTTNGCEVFSDFIPQTNSDVVDQLLEAGSVPLGKTNLHELALGVMGTSGYKGPIHNAVDPTRISGGSSGGSAVSVRLSKGAIISTGSDTGGSVRVPAALNGICGFKPTYELLSTDGVFPLSGSLDHLGLFARSMADLSVGFRAITGSRPLPKRRQRVGIPTTYFVEEADKQVSKDFWHAADLLKDSGDFDVRDVRVDESMGKYARARAVLTLKEGSWFYEPILRSASRKALHKDVVALMDNGLKMGMLRYMQATNLRVRCGRLMAHLLKGLDALLMPTCLVVAPRIDDVVGKETGYLRYLMLKNTELFNLTGLPALSVPARPRGDSLPTGLQIVGNVGQDERVLSVGESVSSLVR
jgi:aspartyl-tRNA(Asn)/glutamyl-tRNA(Gln) amidotransferase subunit A